MKNIETFIQKILFASLIFIVSCSENEETKEIYKGEILIGSTKGVSYPKRAFPKFSFGNEKIIYFSDNYSLTGEGSFKRKVFTYDTETYETKEFLDLNTKRFDISPDEKWLFYVDGYGLNKLNLIDSSKYLFDTVITYNSKLKIDPKQKYIAYAKLNYHFEVCVITFEGDSLICFEESISPSWHPFEEKLIFSKGDYFIVYDFEASMISDTIWAIEGVINENPFYLFDGKEIVFENEEGVWHINEIGEITNLFQVSDNSFSMKELSLIPGNTRSFLYEGFRVINRVNDFDPIITGERAFYIFNVDSILSKK